MPLFLLGLSAFVATWQGWIGFGPRNPHATFERDRATLRNLAEMATPDRDKLNDLLVKVAGSMDSVSDQVPLTHFVLGSGYARLAELTPTLEESKGYWTLAKQHFDQVSTDNFTDSTDKAKLAFRAAKARAAIGLPAEGSVDTNKLQGLIRLEIDLLDTPPLGEDAGEAGRLQADLALRLTPPDLLRARDALLRYLPAGFATPPLARDRAKLLLGDIHYRLKEMDLAKKPLENISTDAPSEIRIPAKALLGRIHMADGNWQAATREWESLRAMPNLPPKLRTVATYNLGVCKLNTHTPEEATKLFAEAVTGQESPETVAAALRLADLYLKNPDAAKHVEAANLLVKAMKGISSALDIRNNPNLNAIEVLATFELALSTLVAEGAFDPALKVVTAYQKIAEGGRDREKRAEILAAWATALEKLGSDFKPRAAEAAKEYAAFSGFQTAVSAKADTLRRAATMYKLAGDSAAALAALQEASKLPELSDEVAGAVWRDLAEALLAAKRPDEVWPTLNEAMSAGRPMSTLVRYRLAHQFAEVRHPEYSRLSRLLFEQIAKQTTVSPAEQEFQELAMVELAHELIRIRDYTNAENILRQQLHTYPNGPQSTWGRLLLGVSLLFLSNNTSPTGPTAAKVVSLRNEALQLFRSIVTEADTKLKKDGKLSKQDSWFRLQAALRVLQTHQYMSNYNDLLAESMDLAERHRGTVEELIIWSFRYQAFWQRYKSSKRESDLIPVLQTRDKMKELFDRLPPSAFNDGDNNEEYSREYWERVWFTPEKNAPEKK
jgi:tetratricopeptide (TPR) repeat protein